MAGLVAYLCLYGFASAFLGELGSSPEEVGLSQAVFVVRAAMYGVPALLLVSAVASIFVFAGWWALGYLRLAMAPVLHDIAALGSAARDVRGRTARRRGVTADFERSGGHLWSRDATGRARRRTLKLTVGCGLVVTCTSTLTLPGPSGRWWTFSASLLAESAFATMLVAVILWPLARLRHGHTLVVLSTSVVVIGLLTSGALLLGTDAAQAIRRADSVHASTAWSFPLEVAGLKAAPVCVVWTSSRPAGIPDDELVYLGHADGVALLTDGDHLFRVRNPQVASIVQRLPGAADTDCPADGPMAAVR